MTQAAPQAILHNRWRFSIALGLVAVVYFACPNARLDFTPFNSHDSESYIALSRSLVEGRGYTRSLDAGVYVPHTAWPPGLPILLAPGVWAAGMPADLLPIKLTVIALGVAGLWLAAAYARRVARSDLAGALVLIGLGLNPFYWHFSRIAMTEVPAFAWTALALWCIDVAWSERRPGLGVALALGALAGFGMLIRATVIGVALVPLLYVIRRRPDGVSLRTALLPYGAFLIGFLCWYAIWSVRNGGLDTTGVGFDAVDQLRMLFVRDPTDPHSPMRALSEIAIDAKHTLLWNVIYNIPQQTIPIAWIAELWARLGRLEAPLGIALTLLVCGVAFTARASLPILTVIAPPAALYLLLITGGGSRYWTYVSFGIVLALAIRLGPVLERRTRRLRIVLVTAIATTSLLGFALYVLDHEREPYGDPDAQALARLFDEIARERRALPAVLSPHPEALHILTGQSAPMFVPGLAIDPQITHVVARSEEWAAACLAGSTLLEEPPWLLVELAESARYSALDRALREPEPARAGCPS